MDYQAVKKQTVMNSPETAMANQVFDQFCNASTLKLILGHFRHLCDLLKIKPNTINQFYPKLKSKLRTWKAQALWKKFDQRANHKCYNRGKACLNTRVLIIGGGPCGLRSAIEAQLLGAKVVVIEKRDRMSRNNVLHLWPFVIQDLRGLGAKKFFGKFCAGSIDHISIRQLQCILLKVALILGVEFHENVSFEALMSPPDNQEAGRVGWRAKTVPADHPASQYEFDILIGADGKRNTLEGFKRKEFRGKLAIAITANFINKRTEAEARVEEISGVAFIFNQKFFKDLYQETGIDLENIVYYKDDTHYFVMTAKKHSLIDKGVILQDHPDTAKLLAKENVDREALMIYAREAAEFSTNYQMLDMEFAVNHYGQPDVAMFDFTSMYAAENASRVLERYGHRLLMILVGDSLLEPFWPTGSGCARGFLSSLDACWAIKGWGSSFTPLEVLAERESIYRLLGQTTPENLNRDYAAYTLDPHSRYPNLNSRSVTPIQVRNLFDTDNPESIKQIAIQPEIDVPKKRRRRETRGDPQVHPDTLLHWLQKQVALYDTVRIEDMGASFKNGLAICAIIHRYRPDLLDFYSLQSDEVVGNNQLAFDILEKEYGIAPIITGEEMGQCDVPDKLAMFSYLTQLYEVFRGEIPHIRHPKMEIENEDKSVHSKQINKLTPEQKVHLIGRILKQDGTTKPKHSRSRLINENIQPLIEQKDPNNRRSRKRRSVEKTGATVEERQKRLEEIENNRNERLKKRQYLRRMATQQFYKSMQMLQANAKREKDEPFEDYSIFVYRQTAQNFKDRVKDLEQKIMYPDKEAKTHAIRRRKNSVDEGFSGRIKSMEDKLRGATSFDKKPKDLLRAIGKIEKTDWNVKEIEKKIQENKMGRGVRHDKIERVPKWSREQFLARQIKLEKKGRNQNETDNKYTDIDNTIKTIDKKIKERNFLGQNKVSAMAEQFANKDQDSEPKIRKLNTKSTFILPTRGGSEVCHFCNKRVYLMERLTAEGKFFHRGCFRCEYCSTSLRIGNHAFDKEKHGGRFYCLQHFGLIGTVKSVRADYKKISTPNKENIPISYAMASRMQDKSKAPLEGLSGFDLLDRGQTPERIEFENLAGLSDTEEAHSQMDEDEWTDRNFGASTAEIGSSDDVSDLSDSDDNEVYEEAMDQPLTTEETLELAKNWTLRYSHPQTAIGQSDTGSNEYEDTSDEYTSNDEEIGTATEDEKDVQARELRKQEVWLKVPPRRSDTDTGSETEVGSDDTTSEESEENSATEISTDSEFDLDEGTPTQHEIPEITINDAYVRKTRGNYVEPTKVQVKSKIIPTVNDKIKQEDNHGKFDANVESLKNIPHRDSNIDFSVSRQKILAPLINPRKGDYLLNRTHSTEGIASKLSLELKKRYLLGGSGLSGTVMKSGSTSNVDTKLRDLTDAISQHQKLLNPAPKPSPTMQAFLQETSKLRSNNTPLSPSNVITKNESPNQIRNINIMQLPDLIKQTNTVDTSASIDVKNDAPTKSVYDDPTPTPTTKQSNEDDMKDNANIDIVHARPLDEDSSEPDSPLQETSIIVPYIDWEKNKKQINTTNTVDSEMENDSLSSNNIELDEIDENVARRDVKSLNRSPPILQIQNINGDIMSDDETNRNKEPDCTATFEPDSIECSIGRDDIEIIKIDSRDNKDTHTSSCSSPTSVLSGLSNKPDDSEDNDATTGAFTETEFSEWARDGEVLVSDDLHDVDPDYKKNKLINPISHTGSTRQPKEPSSDLFYNNTSRLLANGENINFMDTDNESLLDDSLQDTCNAALKQRGFSTTFKLNKDFKVLTPRPDCTNDKYDEAVNKNVNKLMNFKESKTMTFNQESTDSTGDKEFIPSMDEDSLLTIEPTEDTTTSEIITVLLNPTNHQNSISTINVTDSHTDVNHPEYLDYVKRLQSRIAEFSNAKDSIDVRKSRRKNSKTPIQSQTSEIISEEIVNNKEELKETTKELPTMSKRLEEISRERSKQKNVIEDLLMDKLEAHKQKSAEKKAKRAARAFSFTSPVLSPVLKSTLPLVSTSIDTIVTASVMDSVSPIVSTTAHSHSSSTTTATDTIPSQVEQDVLFASADRKKVSPVEETINLKFNKDDEIGQFRTPVPPPRFKHEEAKRTTEKAKQEARNRARLKSDEDLGLSPEDRIKELRMKLSRRQLFDDGKQRIDSYESRIRPSSCVLESSESKLQTSKSTDNVKYFALKRNPNVLCNASTKSMDELPLGTIALDTVNQDQKINKDPERRRGIIQAVSDFFFNKKESSSSSPTSPSSKDKLSLFRITPKSKGKLDKVSPRKSGNRPRSICEYLLDNNNPAELPSHAAPLSSKNSSGIINTEDPLSEEDTKVTGPSMSGEQKSATIEGSWSSLVRKTKGAKKFTRQAQLKRLRMAQEIQRKLEETEVKQKDLENRGVSVEKALRGEGECSDREEADLLREWFDLMKQRTELRRYEKELLVRAQEVQLEDRHERLQQELLERLADNDDQKTNADVKKEGEILTEMLEIVTKRDSLIASLKEEQQRYHDEEKDLEAQMLAKGLRLTPIKKGSDDFM